MGGVFPQLKSRKVTLHYAFSLLQNFGYISLYLVGPKTFAKYWTSIYFGYYLWTWVMMLTHKKDFFYMSRVFWTCHHFFSFFITGTWVMVSPCCVDDDNTYIY